MELGVNQAVRQDDRSGFWLPPAWTLISAYVALNAYFLIVDQMQWNLRFSLIGEYNVAFTPLAWLTALSSILLFVTAIVVHDRRHVMVPLVVLGAAVVAINSDAGIPELFEQSTWWTAMLPRILAPAVAGLVFARWSRGPAGRTTAAVTPTDRQPLRLPGAAVAVLAVFGLEALSVLTVLADDDFLLRNPVASLPLNVAESLVYPSLFVAAFVIARPRALWLAPAVAVLPFLASLLDSSGALCIRDDGTSMNCTLWSFWLSVHMWLPVFVVAVTVGLLAARWSRSGQILRSREARSVTQVPETA